MMHGQVIDLSARFGDNSLAADREYIQIRRQVWAKELAPQVKLIALAIIEHMWAGNLSCYPSKERLIRMVNITERAFDAHYKEAKKLFIIEPRPGRSSIFHARIERVSAELLALFPPARSAWGPPAVYATPYTLPPADSATPPPAECAPPPPADLAGGQNGTPRRFLHTPPADSAGRRDKEEKEDKKDKKDISTSEKPRPYSQSFEDFWKKYPRREGKGKAYSAWKRLNAADRKNALAALEAQLSILAAKSNDASGNFCPHAGTWLGQRRFDDELQERRTEKSGNNYSRSGNYTGELL